MVVVGFIRGDWVHSGAPWGSFGLCVVDVFNRVCPGVRWVHPGSFGSLRFAQGVIGFILGRWVHSGAPWVSLGSSRVALGYALWIVGFILGRSVHSVAP